MAATATSKLTRRQCCARLLTALGGFVAARCATMSPQEEQRLGGKEAEEVARTTGLVRDPRLVQYVEEIGTRLARAAARPDISWQWAVTDDSEANALSLPGGWVYVTRGLLTLSNREDEVAGVLAHEMAHITERHAARRVGAATPLAVLFGVPGGILGMVSPSLGEVVGGAGRVISSFALTPYSREQERDADRVGIGFCARAGTVLELAAEKASWGKPLPARSRRGVSVQYVLGSYVAQVAEVGGHSKRKSDGVNATMGHCF